MFEVAVLRQTLFDIKAILQFSQNVEKISMTPIFH